MDCGNVIKIPTPLSAKSYFPLTSMRRTKTILFPGMASKSIQAIARDRLFSDGVFQLRFEGDSVET